MQEPQSTVIAEDVRRMRTCLDDHPLSTEPPCSLQLVGPCTHRAPEITQGACASTR
jgi:hypothetical protein